MDDHTAPAHVSFIGAILKFFNKSIDNIAYIVGDNCSVNCKIAEELDVSLVGCASHRLNLAVNLMLAEHDQLLDQVQAIMIKLNNSLIAAAHLRRVTTLRPVLRQATRWSSAFAMVRRYIELKEVMDKIDDDEIASILLSRRDEKALVGVLESLKKFESTSKQL